MYQIPPSIIATSEGKDIDNLQAALLFLLKKDIFKLPADTQAFTIKALEAERQQPEYGKTTQHLIRLFQQENILANQEGWVDAGTAKKLNEVLKSLGAFDVPEFVVKGYVRRGDGSGYADAIVKAYDCDLRKEEELDKTTKTTTNTEGYYEIHYKQEEFSRAEKSNADLKIRVFDPAEKVILTSETFYNALPVQEINLSLPAEKGKSEWVMTNDKVSPLLKGQKKKQVRLSSVGEDYEDLPEDELNATDFAFIAKETGLEESHLRLWSLAYARAKEINTPPEVMNLLPEEENIQPEVFYGLFREGIPYDKELLIDQPIDKLRTALKAAIAHNIIRADFEQNVEKILAAIPNTQRDVLQDLGKISSLPSVTMATLVQQVSGIKELNDRLVNQFVKDNVLSVDEAQSLSLGVSLHKLLDGHGQANSALRDAHFERIEGSKLSRTRDLASLNAADVLSALEQGNVLPLPDTSLENMANELVRQIAAVFPTDALLWRATDRRADIAPAMKGLSTLLEKNPNALLKEFDTLDLKGIPESEQKTLRESHQQLAELANLHPGLGLHQILAEPPKDGIGNVIAQINERVGWLHQVHIQNAHLDLLAIDYMPESESLGQINFGGLSPKAQEMVIKDIKVYQRVQSVTSDTLASLSLLKGGYHSAFAIAESDTEGFVAKTGFSLAEADTYQTEAVRLATDASLKWFAVFDTERDYRVLNNTTPFPNPLAKLAKLPGYAELFGSLNHCACKHCQSVLSPAAYFVDLMHFVEQNILLPSFGYETNDLHLKRRRSDLWTLELTCKNAEEYIPYLDVVIKILETFLHETNPSTLYKILSEQDGSIRQPFNLPLERLSILLSHFGVDRYQIAKLFLPDEASKAARVRAKLGMSLKTYTIIQGSRVADLNANLKEAKSYYESQLQIIGNAQLTYQRAKVETQEVDPVDMPTFLKGMGLEREVGVLIFETDFVNSNTPTQRIVIEAGLIKGSGNVQNNIEVIKHLTLGRIDRIERFVRLWRHLPWNVPELDYVLTTLQKHLVPNTPPKTVLPTSRIDDNILDALTELLDLQQRWSLPVDELCALWDVIPNKGLHTVTSLFDRLFNSSVFVKQSGVQLPQDDLYYISSGLPTSTIPIANIAKPPIHARLLAALQISDQDFRKLFNELAFPLGLMSLTKDNLDVHVLYRHARLARLLKMSIEELFQMIRLVLPTSTSTATSTATSAKITSLAELQLVLSTHAWRLESDFSLEEVCFIVGNLHELKPYPKPTELADSIIAEFKSEKTEVLASTVFTIVHLKVAAILQITPEKLDALFKMSGLTIPIDAIYANKLLMALQNGNKQTLIDLLVLNNMIRLTVLFKNVVFDGTAVAWVSNHRRVFDLPVPPANTDVAITIETVRRVARYALLAKAPDPAFEPNAVDVDVQALQLFLEQHGGRLDRLLQIKQALDFSNRLGVSAETLKMAVSDDFDDLSRAADGIYSVFKVKYSDDKLFQEKIEPFMDKIRSRQRDGLVDYLLYPPMGTPLVGLFSKPSDLYNWFLIDVLLEGCARTSRLVAAISSVQLYVHRVLMNLEQSEANDPRLVVAMNPKKPEKRDEWAWRKHYRIWEANRKVFLYPENYIEPGLRDDKTPLFKELEDTLLQQQITDQNVLDAYATYLHGFDEIARLKIAGAYHDQQDGGDLLHLFGVTAGDPPVYYYRAIRNLNDEKLTSFGPWEKINLQIPVRMVSPIVFKGQLYVFWLETTTRPISEFKEGSSKFRGYRHSVRTKFSLMRLDGQWTPPQILKVIDDDKAISDVRMVEDFLPLDTTIPSPAPPPNDNSIRITNNYDSAISWRIFNARGTDTVYLGGLKEGIILKLNSYTFLLPDETKISNWFRIEFRKYPTGEFIVHAGTDYKTPIHLVLLSSGQLTPPPTTAPSEGKVLTVQHDIRKRDHSEPVENYTPEGWIWERAYPGPFKESPTSIESPTLCQAVGLYYGQYDVYGGTPIRDIGPFEILPAFYTATSELKGKKTLNQTPLSAFLSLNLEKSTGLQVMNGNEQSLLVEPIGETLLLMPKQNGSYRLRRLSTTLAKKLGDEAAIHHIDGLLKRSFQETLIENGLDKSGVTLTSLVSSLSNMNPFEKNSALLSYFREVFFQIPFQIADYLNSQQKFAQAQVWYHYIFNPMAADATGTSEKVRPWQYREFREIAQNDGYAKWQDILTNPQALAAYRADPFNPHAIARLRSGAYQKAIVMKYIDNLLDWGDSLFNQFTMESINEATMLYVMAADILGPKPSEQGPCGDSVDTPKTYGMLAHKLDTSKDGKEHDFLIELEGVRITGNDSRVKDIGIIEIVADSNFAVVPAVATAIDLDGLIPLSATGNLLIQPPTYSDHVGWNKAGSGMWQTTTGISMEKLYNTSTDIVTFPLIGTGNGYTFINPKAGGDPVRPGTFTAPGIAGDITAELWKKAGIVPPMKILPGLTDIPRPPHVDTNPVVIIPKPYELIKSTLVFCIPENKDLRAYWDRVEDRLYKIRNCMDIAGVRRRLELFSPEIDPRFLVRMRAAGISLDEVMNVTSGNLPPYRFQYLIEKARQYAGMVQSFGNQLMGALEKRDGEELSRLRAVHEQHLLKLRTKVTMWEINAAEDTLESLRRQKEAVEYRREHYLGLLQTGLSDYERVQQVATHIASGLHETEALIQLLGGALSLLPGIGAPTAMKYGGVELSGAARGFAHASQALAQASQAAATSAGLEGGNQRRSQEWEHQILTAKYELAQIDKQITAAEIRRDIATESLKLHERSIEQSQEIFEFLRDKFSNFGRYTWLSAELQKLNRIAFNAALSMAHLAEKAYRFERQDEEQPTLLTGNYWDAGNAGLLAGDKLLLDLQALEQKYIETNKRELEITKHISLSQLDARALSNLKTTGSCNIDISEARFDMDFPNHYFRRIKSVSLSIPCIAGPYTSVSATLSLTDDNIRLRASDTNVSSGYSSNQSSIATSHGQNDSGMFELNFRDERYLPFEGCGAISTWRLELPTAVKQFDYTTISDIVIHMKYTARAGSNSRSQTGVHAILADSLPLIVQKLNQEGLYIALNLKHDMPKEWLLLKKQNTVAITVETLRLPYMAQSLYMQYSLMTKIAAVSFVVRVKDNPQPFSITIGDDTVVAFSTLNDGWQLSEPVNVAIELNSEFTLAIPYKVEELIIVVQYIFFELTN